MSQSDGTRFERFEDDLLLTVGWETMEGVTRFTSWDQLLSTMVQIPNTNREAVCHTRTVAVLVEEGLERGLLQCSREHTRHGEGLRSEVIDVMRVGLAVMVNLQARNPVFAAQWKTMCQPRR